MSRALAATVIVSPDDEWIRKWNTPQVPRITRLSELQVGQKASVAFLVSGVRAIKGQVRFRVAAQILDPHGKVLFDKPSFATMTQKASLGPAFLLVNPTMDYIAENSDPRGVYRFRAVVTDLNAPRGPKASATGEAKVTLK